MTAAGVVFIAGSREDLLVAGVPARLLGTGDRGAGGRGRRHGRPLGPARAGRSPGRSPGTSRRRRRPGACGSSPGTSASATPIAPTRCAITTPGGGWWRTRSGGASSRAGSARSSPEKVAVLAIALADGTGIPLALRRPGDHRPQRGAGRAGRAARTAPPLAQAARAGRTSESAAHQGLHQERYRLTGSVAASLALSLGMLAIALHGSEWDLAGLVGAGLRNRHRAGPGRGGRPQDRLPGRPARASRSAPNRSSWPGRDSSPVFIPWSDVERIVLYSGPTSGETVRQGAAVQRHPALPWCPAPAPRAAGGPADARCPAWPRAPPGRSSRGGWIASGWPPSPRPWPPAFRSSTPAQTPEGLPSTAQPSKGRIPASWSRRRRSPVRIRCSGRSRRCPAPSCSSCRRSSSGGRRP